MIRSLVGYLGPVDPLPVPLRRPHQAEEEVLHLRAASASAERAGRGPAAAAAGGAVHLRRRGGGGHRSLQDPGRGRQGGAHVGLRAGEVYQRDRWNNSFLQQMLVKFSGTIEQICAQASSTSTATEQGSMASRSYHSWIPEEVSTTTHHAN